jgi:hypothetical protein
MMRLEVRIVSKVGTRAGAAVVGVWSVAKKESEYRRSSPVPVLDHAARSKSGFAPGESRSTTNRRFSVYVLDRPIAYDSMAD